MEYPIPKAAVAALRAHQGCSLQNPSLLFDRFADGGHGFSHRAVAVRTDAAIGGRRREPKPFNLGAAAGLGNSRQLALLPENHPGPYNARSGGRPAAD